MATAGFYRTIVFTSTLYYMYTYILVVTYLKKMNETRYKKTFSLRKLVVYRI